ncbi:MAG TPA: gliding motility-associated C-terminal domain-containing protein, partial [Flavisolibacter sp.]|nr:gliding motility-associated C-terminal domain-containing protein [Flavisolibacter sp.]
TITIVASANNICNNSPITFTATTSNAGTAPMYQWKRNGINIGANSPTYTTNSSALTNGDIIECTVTSNTVCATTIANSNRIAMAITPTATPVLLITSSANNICFGQSVTFTATPTNGGTNPVFQWKLNGSNVGTNSDSYTAATLENNDVITCELTSNALCLSTPKANSNAIIMTVKKEVTPEVTINADALSVCAGATVNFTATNKSNSPNPSYHWLVNGITAGTNSTSFTSESLSSTITVQCIMTTPHCTTGSTKDYSNPITILVNPLPVITFNTQTFEIQAGHQATLNAQVAGDMASFKWTPTNALINSTTLTPLTKPLYNTTTYQLEVTSTAGCKAYKDITIRVIKQLYMPSSFTPNGDGFNDIFRIPLGTTLTLKNFSVFDRWGNRIFTTTNQDTGWNGNFKSKPAPSGIYAYSITGTTPKGEINVKGTVMLLRNP